MQKKVDLLISLVHRLNDELKDFDLPELSNSLLYACKCLKSQDLIGLKIILIALNKDNFKKKYWNDELEKQRIEVIELVQSIQQDFDKSIISFTKGEEIFLNLSYNKFYDITSEVFSQEFWNQVPSYRLSKISQAFAIYSEILNYEPIKGVLSWISKHRPPMESDISGPLFKFTRNILAHFPFFDSWDDIWISKDLINWRHSNQSIDKFLQKYSGKTSVKYRFKEKLKSEFTFVTINFPKNYDGDKIYLKDIITEKEGVKFSIVMMLRVLNTQVESIKE